MKYKATVINHEGKPVHSASNPSLSALLLDLSAWVYGKGYVHTVKVEWSK